ncbi:type 1 fimbrial protein [Haemophilus influenzae]|nr:type 1 fimbrial protein [Haemophilus influenzae]
MKKTILALLALGVFGVANATEADHAPRTAIKPAGTAGAEIPYQRATAVDNSTNGTHAKITVTGEVLNTTCEIQSGDRDQTIKLKSVGTNQLKKVGDVAADHLVQIKLENCKTTTTGNPPTTTAGTGTKKVTVTFNATDKIDNYNDGTLRNLAPTNAAKNVNIQFANLNGKSIRLGANDPNNTLTPTEPAKGGEHVVEFLARYYATGPSEAGQVKGEAELDLAYE